MGSQFTSAYSPVEGAVKAIIEGSHLSNHELYFYPISAALSGLLKGQGTRYPAVTADLMVTGGSDRLRFADLNVAVIVPMPEVRDFRDFPTYMEAVRSAKQRHQADLLEVVDWLTGRRKDTATNKPLWNYAQTGNFEMEVEYDAPDAPLPEGRILRVMTCTLSLPLVDTLGARGNSVFTPQT